MEHPIDRDELKELIKKALVEVLEGRRDLLHDAVSEALEDLALVRAIGEGENTETVARQAMTERSVNINQYIALALRHAEYEENEDGTWTVTVPVLPGVVTYGETKEEAEEMAKDAVRNWVEVAERFGDPIPAIDDQDDL